MATANLIDPSHLDPEALALRGEVYWALVSGVFGDDVAVSHDGRSSLAKRAASCLLAPRPGDLVLLARVDQRAFILSVLERDGDVCEIDVDGDLELRSRRGAVTVEAKRELRLRTPDALSVTGKTLTFAAQSASWVASHLRLLAEQLSIETTRTRHVASFSEVVIESVKETLGRSHREIRDSEHVQAESMTLSLRKVLRAHADTAIVTAKKLAKINADQIHLG